MEETKAAEMEENNRIELGGGRRDTFTTRS